MTDSTLTAKGQTTVPAEIRASMQAQPGMRLVWSAMPDGTVIVRAKNRSITELAGLVEPPPGRHIAVDAMTPWR